MYVCLSALALLMLASNLHCRSKMHRAKFEAWVARQRTEGYKHQLNEQVARGSFREAVLLTEIGKTALDCARAAIVADAWKSYALGYEVFCEAAYDGDDAGILNAGTEIASARNTLQAMGEYNA